MGGDPTCGRVRGVPCREGNGVQAHCWSSFSYGCSCGGSSCDNSRSVGAAASSVSTSAAAAVTAGSASAAAAALGAVAYLAENGMEYRHIAGLLFLMAVVVGGPAAGLSVLGASGGATAAVTTVGAAASSVSTSAAAAVTAGSASAAAAARGAAEVAVLFGAGTTGAGAIFLVVKVVQRVWTFTCQFALWMRQTFAAWIDPTVELLVALAAICALCGEHGFEVFLKALRRVYSKVGEWANHLKSDLENLMDRMNAIAQILKDSKAEEKYKNIENELQPLAANAWLLATTASVINQGGDPEVVEQKKQEARQIGKEMLSKADELRAWMGEADPPGIPSLDLLPLLEISPILHDLP